MLEISEQHISSPEHRALRGGVSSHAVGPLASRNSRTSEQPFAILLESRPSETRGRTCLQTHPFTAAQSNAFRMKLLQKHQNNFCGDHGPGRIPSRRTLLESAHSGDNLFAENQQKISRLESHPCTYARITALESHSCKKGGGEGWLGALFRPLIESGELI